MDASVRSYVCRNGRITAAQKRVLTESSPHRLTPAQMAQAIKQAIEPVLEIGFGNGASLLELAACHPQATFFGVEVYRSGMGRCLMQAQAQELNNLYVCLCDVMELLPLIDHAYLSRVLIFNPDPWPRKRHHKRRLITVAFLRQLARCCRSQARLQMTTDWPSYAEHIAACLANQSDFISEPVQTLHAPEAAQARSIAQADHIEPVPQAFDWGASVWWPNSRFQQVAHAQRRSIHRFHARKRA